MTFSICFFLSWRFPLIFQNILKDSVFFHAQCDFPVVFIVTSVQCFSLNTAKVSLLLLLISGFFVSVKENFWKKFSVFLLYFPVFCIVFHRTFSFVSTISQKVYWMFFSKFTIHLKAFFEIFSRFQNFSHFFLMRSVLYINFRTFQYTKHSCIHFATFPRLFLYFPTIFFALLPRMSFFPCFSQILLGYCQFFPCTL